MGSGMPSAFSAPGTATSSLLVSQRRYSSSIIVVRHRLAEPATGLGHNLLLYLFVGPYHIEDAGGKAEHEQKYKQPRPCAEPLVEPNADEAANDHGCHQLAGHAHPVCHAAPADLGTVLAVGAGLALGAQLVETVAEIGNSSFERSPFLGAHLALVRTSVISLFRHESHVLGRRPDSPEGAPSNAGRTIGMGVLSVKETGERQALPSGRKIGALGLVNCGALGVPARGCSDHPKGARWQ